MTVSESNHTLATLLPEIFHIVSSHLPLYSHPSTLLALALTDHRLKDIIIPRLLYQQVWLDGEKRAMQVLSKLKTQAQAIDAKSIQQGGEIPLAHHVRRLFIICELSKDARAKRVDTVTQLRLLIDLGGLPNLVSLALHMSGGWYVGEGYEPIQGFGRLDRSFWSSLKENCPKLKEISLTGVTDDPSDRWVEVSGLFEYQGLESLRLEYQRYHIGIRTPGQDESPPTLALHRLYDNLTSFSPFLHTLALSLENEEPVDVTADNGLFMRHFPHLRVLILLQFAIERPEVAAQFWSGHPNLERVELSYVSGCWFGGLSTGTLPKLKILKAPFDDVRTLLPVLGDQLVNLTISSSINAQVPYLLRSVLPNGLASLRSLGIYQRASRHSAEDSWEGSRWCEDEHGNIVQISKRKMARPFDDIYLMSIARGAPNLEELELIGESKPPIEPIAISLSMFSNLKRLYISGTNHGVYQPFIDQPSIITDMPHKFLEVACDIARGCATLECITEISREMQNISYVTAKTRQGTDGTLVLCEEGGCGRVIGLEDDDYPGFL